MDKKRRALFLDRDGVINVNHGYVHKAEDFDFIDGIFDLIATAKARGYLVIVVTNQAGIGRGFYNEETFNRLMDWVRGEVRKRQGDLDGVYFCPDHPEHGIGPYKRDTAFRKPGPGMLIAAIADFNVDPAASLMVGDALSDMQAARAAGIGRKIFLCEKGERPAAPELEDITIISRLPEVLALLETD